MGELREGLKEKRQMRTSSFQYRLLPTIALALSAPCLALIFSCAPTGNVEIPADKPSPNPTQTDAVAAAVAPKAGTPVQAEQNADDARTWPTFFGSPSRNPVNTVGTNVATEWSIDEGAAKNIKWVQTCGSRSYAGPV